MAKPFEASSTEENDSVLEVESDNPDHPPQEQRTFLALTKGSEPNEKNGLPRATANATALAEKERFGLDKATLPRKALVRPTRTVTLDPDRLASHLVTLQEVPTPEAEQQYRRLAINLITTAAKRSFKRILFISAQHGEGRTSVMLNLAGALARAKLRVLVVDTDFMRPSVMRLLGIESEVGIAEVLTRERSAQEATITLSPLSLTVLVTREAVDSSAEILGSVEFQELINLCEPDYDFIFFDSPPLLDAADAILLTRMVDSSLLVIRPGATSADEMARAVASLNQEDISGVVMNRVLRK